PHAARLMSVAHARATVRVRFIPRTVGELWAINGPARAFGGVGRTNSPITDQAVKSCLLRQRRFWSAGRGARVANQWIVVPAAAFGNCVTRSSLPIGWRSGRNCQRPELAAQRRRCL